MFLNQTLNKFDLYFKMESFILFSAGLIAASSILTLTCCRKKTNDKFDLKGVRLQALEHDFGNLCSDYLKTKESFEINSKQTKFSLQMQREEQEDFRNSLKKMEGILEDAIILSDSE